MPNTVTVAVDALIPPQRLDDGPWTLDVHFAAESRERSDEIPLPATFAVDAVLANGRAADDFRLTGYVSPRGVSIRIR